MTRTAIAGALMACLTGFCGGFANAADATAPAVVELYTSQGCSSCPPADRILGKLADDPNVIALSFAVDYWDFLGWKDQYARPEFTKRQRAYAKARGDRSVFTPQAIVNGREAVIGSHEGEIRSAIADMRADGTAPTIPVTVKRIGDRVVVSVSGRTTAVDEKTNPHVALWIASYLPPRAVDIKTGENSGQAITYTNIVSRWQVLGMWDGEPMTVELALSDIAQEDAAGLAVILQSKQDGLPGPILGAAKLSLQSGS